jgi:hypothetical protein
MVSAGNIGQLRPERWRRDWERAIRIDVFITIATAGFVVFLLLLLLLLFFLFIYDCLGISMFFCLGAKSTQQRRSRSTAREVCIAYLCARVHKKKSIES